MPALPLTAMWNMSIYCVSVYVSLKYEWLITAPISEVSCKHKMKWCMSSIIYHSGQWIIRAYGQ